jgi:hypothetical protein
MEALLRDEPIHVVVKLIDHYPAIFHQSADNQDQSIAKNERQDGE